MGWFSGKKSISESPEIGVKTRPLIKPGWWITNRLPKPHRSEQPHLSDASHSFNSSSTFSGSTGTYARSKRSDSYHQNAAAAFEGHEETYRSASRSNSYHLQDPQGQQQQQRRQSRQTPWEEAQELYRTRQAMSQQAGAAAVSKTDKYGNNRRSSAARVYSF